MNVHNLHGKLIVIEGLDGSGKATQAKRLVEALQAQGQTARAVSFPNYASDSSALIKMYLSGQFGSDPDDVNAYAASSFYAVDRYAGFKKDWGVFYKNGGMIIADRYTTSNAIHQCSKLPDHEWESYLEWLFTYEYELLGIPAPDLVIYLHMDLEVSQRLIAKRHTEDNIKKDIHESNLDYLRRSEAAAEYCSRNLGWKTVLCSRDGEPKTVEEVHQEVMGLVSSCF